MHMPNHNKPRQSLRRGTKHNRCPLVFKVLPLGPPSLLKGYRQKWFTCDVHPERCGGRLSSRGRPFPPAINAQVRILSWPLEQAVP